MSVETESKEQRILRMVKKVITDIAKDTHTLPGIRHPLSDSTINNMRACLDLIVSREAELTTQHSNVSSGKPHFTDEPSGNITVQLKSAKPNDDKPK